MSPVGHALVGLAAVELVAGDRRGRERIGLALTYVLLANLPDCPLPGWGHDAYHVSHSLLVNVAAILFACLVLRAWFPKRILACGAAAWLSHLLLDSFYSHGLGVWIGWPVSDYRLNLPIPWLKTLDLSQPLGSHHNLSVGLLEAATFGPVWLIGWFLSRVRTND